MMVRYVSAIALLTGFALAACAPDFNPPPDYQGGFLWDSDHSRTITVGADDTLYTLSRRYDVPTKVIVGRNNLRAPYALTPGQTLILDPVRTHHVQSGETVAALAAKYRVPQSLIVEANDLPAPYTLREGQSVWIPDPFTVAAAEPLEPPPPRAAPTSEVVRVPTAPGATTAPLSAVRSGGGTIAATALPPPPGATAFPGSPGAPVMMPPPEGQPPVIINPAQPDTARFSREGVSAMAVPPSQPTDLGLSSAARPQTPSERIPAPAPPPLEKAPAAPMPAPPVVANPPQPAPPPQVASLPPAPPPSAGAVADPAATKFTWPVKGRLISGFGPSGEGLHNDGINIAAPQGAQVRAAGTGTVVYAGSELKGFGNLLLIKHDNGLTTAYAHADKLLVAKGDKVRQGQVVATVGKTGNVTAPQLHFEVRRGTQAVDPQAFLQQ